MFYRIISIFTLIFTDDFVQYVLLYADNQVEMMESVFPL